MSDGAPTADPCLEAIDVGGGFFGGEYQGSHLQLCRAENNISACYDFQGNSTTTTEACLNASLQLNIRMPQYVQEQSDLLTQAGHGYTFHSIFYTNPAYANTPDAIESSRSTFEYVAKNL